MHRAIPHTCRQNPRRGTSCSKGPVSVFINRTQPGNSRQEGSVQPRPFIPSSGAAYLLAQRLTVEAGFLRGHFPSFASRGLRRVHMVRTGVAHFNGVEARSSESPSGLSSTVPCSTAEWRHFEIQRSFVAMSGSCRLNRSEKHRAI